MNGTGSGRAQPAALQAALQADPLADLREVLRATRPGARRPPAGRDTAQIRARRSVSRVVTRKPRSCTWLRWPATGSRPDIIQQPHDAART